jgi:hypothetical protein
MRRLINIEAGAQCVQWEVTLATEIIMLRKLACWNKSGHLAGMSCHSRYVTKQEGWIATVVECDRELTSYVAMF